MTLAAGQAPKWFEQAIATPFIGTRRALERALPAVEPARWA